MKKSKCLISLFATLLLFATVACDHTHEYGNWALTTNPTITEQGKAERTCSVCGDKEEVDVPILTNDSVWTVATIDATCEEAGSNTYTSIYGQVVVAIHVLEHTEVIDAAVAPAYGQTGLTEGTHCSACGEVLVAQQIIPALIKVTANANSNTFGSVAQSKELVSAGDEIAVTATPNEGYTFFGWFEGDVLISDKLEYTFNMPLNDYSLTARFTAPKKVAWDGSIATAFAGGDGTQANQYLISTGSQLAYLANAINSSDQNTLYNKHYLLTNSIDLGSKEWYPIGVTWGSSEAFSGIFDGNGFVVSSFKITLQK